MIVVDDAEEQGKQRRIVFTVFIHSNKVGFPTTGRSFEVD